MAMTGGTSVLVYTGYSNGESGRPIKVYVYYKSVQYPDTNTSKVYCGMYVTSPAAGDYIGPWTDFNGSYVGKSSLTFDGTIPSFSGTRWLVENKSFDVSHNSDGSGTVTIAWKWGVNSSWGRIQNISGSFQKPLPTIPRGSKPSCITYPTTTNDVGTIGTSFTIYMNRVVSSYTHTVDYIFGSNTTTWTNIGTNVGTSISWTMPVTLCQYATTSMTGVGTIRVKTYNGGTLVGEKTVSFTAHIPEYSVSIPSGTITIGSTNATINQWGVAVATYSTLGWSVTAGASVRYNSIKRYSITLIQDQNDLSVPGVDVELLSSGTSSSGTTGILTRSGTYCIRITVVDSRDKVAHYIIPNGASPRKFIIYEYTSPKIQGGMAFRCTDQGVSNVMGTYVLVSCTGIIGSDIGGHNSVTTLYQWRVVGGTYSATASIPAAAISGFDATSAYEVKIIARDTLGGEATQLITVPLGKTDFHLTPHGAGFGMYHDSSVPDTIQTSWDLEIKGSKMTEFVIDQGVSGDWSYRKWFSGIVELWQVYSFNSLTTSTQWAGYYTAPIGNFYFPEGLFIHTPFVSVSVEAGNFPGHAYCNISTSFGSTGAINLACHDSRSISGQVNIYAKGIWKD